MGVRTRGWNGERGLIGELAQRSPPPPPRKPPPLLKPPPRNVGGDRDLRLPKPLGVRERPPRRFIGDLGDADRFLGDLPR